MNRRRPWRAWRRVFPPHPESEVDEELQFHIDERIADYISQGMTPAAARAAASERLGDITGVRRTCTSMLAAERTAARRRRMVKVSWLDVKLGVRMFAKHPGLSLVSVFGMAVAIAIAAGYFAMFGAMLDSTLPFDPDGRVVAVLTKTLRGSAAGDTMLSSVHDFEHWRDRLKSVADLSAFRDQTRNLITAGKRTYLVRVASMTASGFRVAAVAPALGRTLLAEDERPSAAPVVVIAYEEWQRRFSGDPGILGQSIRLDETRHTIVGVMPEGFAFPINHRYWVPLRPTEFDRRAEAPPSVNVFGRLAPGLSLENARTELKTIGERMTTALPQTHKDVRPLVESYTHAVLGLDGPAPELALRSIQFGVSLLLLIVAVNVSILVYARTATRAGEIAVRTALGASRARVVAQLFIEALVPSVTAAGIGLGLLSVALMPVRSYFRNSPDADGPYWINEGSLVVSPGVIIYAAVLATIAAVIVGVLPALKATGRRAQASLQQFSARGAGMRLGGTWTALIILQVAVAVVALPPALYKAERAYRTGVRQPPSAAARLLRATLEMSRDGDEAARAQDAALFTARMTAWLQTLESEPGVSGVTYADRFPGEEGIATVAADTGGAELITIRAQPNFVATNFFEVLGVRVLAGRGFTTADASPGADAIVVDHAFAERLGSGNVLGRRIRFSNPSPDGTEDSRWYEIIGVVPAFTATFVPAGGFRDSLPRFYHAARPGDDQPAAVIIQVRSGDPSGFSQRLREITASVSPTLKLERLVGVVEEIQRDRQAFRYMSLGIIAVTVSVLLLSAAGIYAMMSFTVAKRRREIGIRAALGADARHVLMGIFGRAAAQIGAGVAGGLAMLAALERLGGADVMGGRQHVLLPGVAALMFVVGVLAALGPARRGLAVQPIEALREE